MPDLLDEQPEDESGKGRKENPPENKEIPTGEISRNIRNALRGKNEVEISGADSKHPIVLHLPASVARIVRLEQAYAEKLKNPADQLAHDYQEWENCTSTEVKAYGKGMTTCYRDPVLLYWTLEHFSDEDFPLTEEQKQDLMVHALSFAGEQWSSDVMALMSTENTDSLEYFWYILVWLMAIDQKLATKDQSNPRMQQHRELIHNHVSMLLGELTQHHEMGSVTVDSPREEMEGKLIELVRNHPHFRRHATLIMQKWEAMEQTAEELRRLISERSFQLHNVGREDVDVDDDDGEGGVDFVAQLRQQADTYRKLSILLNIMMPEDDDPAWHHPVEYIEGLSDGKYVIFLESSCAPSKDENLSNGQKFDIAFMERMTERGFRHWLFSQAGYRLESLHVWLKENGDSRSLKSLMDALQQYMNLRRGNRIPAMRDFLLFPNTAEPLAVTQSVRYWQEIWDAKERVGAEVRLYTEALDNERAAAMEWLRATADKKFIAIGGAPFRLHAYGKKCASPDSSLVLHHRSARSQYEWQSGKFNFSRAVPFVAHEIGKRKGWGIHQSSAMPIKRNERFLDEFESGELQEALLALRVEYAAVLPNSSFIDAAIFTEEENGEPAEEFPEPSDVDATMPFVNA